MSGEQRIVIEKSEDSKKLAELQAELEKLKQEKEAVEEEAEGMKTKLTAIAEKAFSDKKASLGCQDPEIDTPEKLLAWEKGRQGKSGKAGAGTVPLTSRQYGIETDVLKKKYPNNPEGYQEMMKDLHEAEKNTENSPEERARIRAVLDELLIKAIRTSGEAEIPLNIKRKKA